LRERREKARERQGNTNVVLQRGRARMKRNNEKKKQKSEVHTPELIFKWWERVNQKTYALQFFRNEWLNVKDERTIHDDIYICIETNIDIILPTRNVSLNKL
jgi:hypothetical protein